MHKNCRDMLNCTFVSLSNTYSAVDTLHLHVHVTETLCLRFAQGVGQRLQKAPVNLRGLSVSYITKTCLFNYTENFTTKKMKVFR